MIPRAIPITANDPAFPPYEVLVGSGLLSDLGPTLANTLGADRRAFLIYDRDLPQEHVAEASRSLAHHGYAVSSAFGVATETEKTLDSAERLLEEVAITRHERRDPIVALGGGIVGDLAGFVAATYRRGVPVVQCPTTLLAMVDASVGGKTGVNLATERGLLKNFVGAFHQPALVVADVKTLATLSDRQFCAGLAECVKHALLSADCGDADLLAWMASTMPRFLARESEALTDLVARNVAVKARVVRDDPREERATSDGSGLSRMLLNLGHTFAHAFETLPGVAPLDRASDTPLLHGEAVALGLVAACAAGEHLGMTDPETTRLALAALTAAGLPTRAINLPPSEDLAARMMHDKKVAQGKLRLIVPTGPGRCTIIPDAPHEAAIAGLDAIRA
ncbi:MAG: 3-dehydroquinate synthase [Phycisphaeraceae bacterium]|nr:3-dehydroquinate synthase [Phycisphaeraceae bacterium]